MNFTKFIFNRTFRRLAFLYLIIGFIHNSNCFQSRMITRSFAARYRQNLLRSIIGFKMQLSTDIINKTVKRKVAIVAGYVGTGYYGLQMNATASDSLPTIENEIRKALLSSNHILQSNGHDLSRVSWSRSSRTDKGVHAARIILSAKLELPPSFTCSDTDRNATIRLSSEIHKINSFLPPLIRVFGGKKVQSSFTAKDSCHWRAYEYIIPIEALRDSPDEPVHEVIDRFNGHLKKFEGCQCFHNFHRLSARAFRPPKYEKGLKTDGNDDAFKVANSYERSDDEESNGGREDEGISEDLKDSLTIDSSDVPTPKRKEKIDPLTETRSVFERWEQIPREKPKKVNNVIYKFHAEATQIVIENKESLVAKVTIIGQSFLLHQIRLMISAGVLSTKRILPEYFIDMALTAPVHFHLPLAPAEGLVLVNAGFQSSTDQPNLPMAPEFASTESEAEAALLTSEEYKESQEFLETNIYPRMLSDWFVNDSKLMKEYLHMAGRFAPPAHVLSEWNSIYNEHKTIDSEENQSKLLREQKRAQQCVREFLEATKDVNLLTLPMKEIKKIRREYIHRRFLPSSIASYMAIHYSVMPGELINSVLHILASRRISEAKKGHSTDDYNTIESILEMMDREMKDFSADSALNIRNKEALKDWCEVYESHKNIAIE